MTHFEAEYDADGFELPLPAEACTSRDSKRNPTPCSGPVQTRYSRSGMTSTFRCEGHEYEHQQVLDGIEQRYPDSSTAPSWFDPTYAGERWDDDY